MQERDYDQLMNLLNNPTTEMLEAGSLASDYDLSQVGAGKVWEAMADMLIYRIENPIE